MLEIQKNSDKGYRFIIKSKEGHSLLESIDFSSKKKIEKCFEQMRPRLESPSCFERKTNHKGQFQFILKGPKGKVLGYSATYSSEAGMENGIKNTLSSLSLKNLP